MAVKNDLLAPHYVSPVTGLTGDPAFIEDPILSRRQLQSRLTPVSSEATPMGQFGVGSKYYDEGILPSDIEYGTWNDKRASAQGFGAEMVNSLYQTVVGEGIGGMIEGVGYLTSLSSYTNAMDETNFQTGNLMAEAGRKLRESTKETAPIFVGSKNEGFDPLSREWWFKNIPTIASSVAILAPVWGTSKMLSGIGKSLGLAKKLRMIDAAGDISKFGKAAKTVVQTGISRQIEALMEGTNTYQDIYNTAIREGMSDFDANLKASGEATKVYRRNWAMVAQDLLQYSYLNKAFAVKELDESFEIAKQAGQSLLKPAYQRTANFFGNAFGEGLEEGYQFVLQEEAKYSLQKMLHPETETPFDERLNGYFKEGEMMTSMFFGAIGGMAMHGAGKALQSYEAKKKGLQTPEDVALEDMGSWHATIRAASENYKDMLARGDDEAPALETAKNTLVSTLGLQSTLAGNEERSKEMVEAIFSNNEEDLARLNISKEEAEFVRKMDKESLQKDFARLNEILAKNKAAKDSGKSQFKDRAHIAYAAYHEFMSEKLAELKTKSATKVADLQAQRDSKLTSSITPTNRSILDATESIEVMSRNIRFHEAYLKRLDPKSKDYRDTQELINDNKALLDLFKVTKESLEKARTPEDKKPGQSKAVKALKELVPGYVQAKAEDQMLDDQIKKNEKDLVELQTLNGYEAYLADIKGRAKPETGEPVSPVDEDKPIRIFKEGAEVQFTDPESGAEMMGKIVKINETGSVNIELYDDKGKPTGVIVTKDSEILSYVDSDYDGFDSDEDGFEPSDDTKDGKDDGEIDEDTEKEAHPERVTAGYTDNDKKEPYQGNEALDEFLSNPDNSLQNVRAYFNIINFAKNVVSQEIPKELRDRILAILNRKEGDFTESKLLKEIDDLLDTKITTGKYKGYFVSDVIPVSISIYDPSTKRVLGNNVYLYKGSTKKDRMFRRQYLIPELLLGNKVYSKGLDRSTTGWFNNVKGQNKNVYEAFGLDKNGRIELGISDHYGNIKGSVGISDLGFSKNRGNIYIFTKKNPKAKRVPVKLNTQKISAEHAAIVWDALQLIHKKGKGGNRAKFGKDYAAVQGLGALATVNLLVNWGESKTNVKLKKNEKYLGEHLASKQLFTFKPSKDSIWFLNYGGTVIPLFNPELSPGVEDTANKKAFIEWATKNKNYAVNLKSDQLGITALNAEGPFNTVNGVGKSFKVGSFEYDGKRSYGQFILDNNMVKTDIQTINGSVFHSPLLTIPTDTKFMTVVDASTDKARKPGKNLTAPERKLTLETTVKEEQKGGPVHISTAEQIIALPIGTRLYVTMDIEGETKKLYIGRILPSGDPKLAGTDDDKVISIERGFASDPSLKPINGAQTNRPWVIERILDRFKPSELTNRLYIDLSEVKKEAAKPTTLFDDKGFIAESAPSTDNTPISTPKATPTDPSLVQTNSEEDTDGLDDWGITGDDVLTRSTDEEEREEYERQDIEKEVFQWFKETFGEKAFRENLKFSRTILKIGDKEAWGIFKKDLITIYTGAETGTIYHEAFHRILRLYLSKEEISAIYKEALVKYADQFSKTKKPEKGEIEDVIAEAFRERVIEYRQAKEILSEVNKYSSLRDAIFAISQQEKGIRSAYEIKDSIVKAREIVNPKAVSGIAKFFRDLINAIYEFFGGTVTNTALIDELFNKINTGGFANKDIVNTTFEKVFTKTELAEGLTKIKPKKNKEAIESLDTNEQINKLTKGLTKLVITLNNVDDLNSVSTLKDEWVPVIASLKSDIEALVKLRTDKNKKEVDRLEKLYTEVVTDLEKESGKSVFRELVGEYLLNINIRKTVSEVLAAEDDNNEMNIIRSEMENIDKPSYAINLKSNTMAAIKYMVATLPESNRKDPFTRMYEFVDFNKMWSSLMRDLHDKNDIEEMVTALRARPGIFAYQVLADKLEKANDIIKNQFLVSFRMHRHSYLNMIFDRDKKYRNSFTYMLSNADTLRASKVLVSSWNQRFFRMSDLVTRGDKINYVANESKINDIKNRYKSLVTEAKSTYAKNNADFTVKEAESLSQRIISLYKAINVDLDIDTLTVHLKGAPETYNSRLYSFIVDNNKSQLVFDVMLNALLVGDKSILKAFSDISVIRNIADSYAEAHPEYINDSILGPGNNVYYTYSLRSYTTNVIEKLKKDESYIDELQSKLYTGQSYLLDQLRDPEVRKNLTLQTFSMIKTPDNRDGEEYTKLSPVDDYIMKLVFTHNSIIPFPILSDKSTYYLLKGLKTLENVIEFDENKVLSVTEDTLNLFYRYFLDEKKRIEMNTVQIVNYLSEKDPVKKAELHKKLVVNYHFNPKARANDKGFFAPAAFGMKKNDQDGYSIVSTEGSKFIPGSLKFHHFSSLNGLSMEQLIDENAVKNEISDALVRRIEAELDYADTNKVITRELDNNGDVVISSNLHMPSIHKKYGDAYGDVSLGNIAMIAEYAVNTIMATMEIEKIFSGDPAFYSQDKKFGETHTDKIKRLGALIATGKQQAETTDNWGDDLTKRSYTSAILNTQEYKSYYYKTLLPAHTNLIATRLRKENPDMAEADIMEDAFILAQNNLAGYKDIDPTDGQVYLTPRMYRSIMIRLGEWDAKKDFAYDLLMSQRELKPEEEQEALNVVMQPLKLVYFALDQFENLNLPTYDKMSLAPLFRRIWAPTGIIAQENRTDIDDLLDRMEAVGKYAGTTPIDMIKFASATKVGGSAGTDFYTDPQTKEKINDLSGLVTREQYFTNLSQQMVTDPHEGTETKVGTQVIKIALSNIQKDTEYVVEGDKMSSDKLIATVNECLSILSNIGKKEILDRLGFNEETGKIDNAKFVELLRSDARKSGMPDSVIDALDVDADGQLYLNIDSFPDRAWIQSRILSLINKSVIDRVLPGKNLILMSDFGITRKAYDNSLKFVTTYLNQDGDVKRINAMEVDISINIFKDVIPKDLKTHDEKVAYLNANLSLVERHLMGYRIPTQGLNSIVALKVRNFLRENLGDTIILPAEITKQTGSDFDIDKLYIIRHNYDFNEKGGFSRYRINPDIPLEQNGAKAIENRLISSYMSILLSKDHFVDNTTPLGSLKPNLLDYVKILNKTIYAESAHKLDSFGSATPSFHTDTKYRFTGGKFGIAPFALNKAHHVIAQMFNLHLAEETDLGGNYNLIEEGYDMSKINGMDNRPISEWLSVLIDAHVDLAKDPYIMTLNVNEDTYEELNFMLRAGFGDASFLFIAQPIMIELVNNLKIARSSILNPREANMSPARLFDIYYSQIRQKYQDLTGEERDPKREVNLKVNFEDLKKQFDLFLEPTKEYYQYQLDVLDTFRNTIKPNASSLFTLVLANRVDTGKFGANIVELQSFINKNKQVFDDERINYEFKRKVLVEFDDDKYNKDNSFIYNYYINSVLLADKIFSKITLPYTKGFKDVVNYVLESTGNRHSQDNKFIAEISNEIFSILVSEFFDKKFNGETRKHVEAIIFDDGKNIISKIDDVHADAGRFEVKDGKIVNDTRKYGELYKNKIINNIIPVLGLGEIVPNFFKIPVEKLSEKWERDDMVRSWEELLFNENLEIRNIGLGLYYYSYYTSGFRRRLNSFFNHIPTSLVKDNGYDKFIKEKLVEFQTNPDKASMALMEKIHNLFENNSTSYKIVPLLNNRSSEKKASPSEKYIQKINRSYPDKQNQPEGIIGSIYIKDIHDTRRIMLEKELIPIYRPYIRYEDNDVLLLMKYVGTLYTKDPSTDKFEYVGVYVPVNTKGTSAKGQVLREYYSGVSLIESNNLPKGHHTPEAIANHLSTQFKGAFFTEDYLIKQISRDMQKVRKPKSVSLGTPEFNKLPSKSIKPTMTYAGIGSRETPSAVLNEMKEVSQILSSKGYTLRSGNAPGADRAFQAGTDNSEIFVAEDATTQTLKIAREIHPNPNAIDSMANSTYVWNVMARNTNQVFGENLDTPVDFILAWTPDGLENSADRTIKSGGTGQAIDMASRKGIPVINMKNPDWHKKLDAILDGTYTGPKTGTIETKTADISDKSATDILASLKEDPKSVFEISDAHEISFSHTEDVDRTEMTMVDVFEGYPEVDVTEISKGDYYKEFAYGDERIIDEEAALILIKNALDPDLSFIPFTPVSTSVTEESSAEKLTWQLNQVDELNKKFSTSYTLEEISQLPIEEQRNLIECLNNPPF